MEYIDKLDRLYPKLRIGRKCSNPNCNHMAHHVHHIVGRDNLILRFDVNNLLPLCEECHRKIHDEGAFNRGRDFITPEREEYINKYQWVVFKDYLLQNGLSKDEFFALKETELLRNIGKTEYKQNTPEWLEQKQSTVGASEIASVVKSFVPQDVLKEIMGEKVAQSFIDEPLYSTGYQVFHKVACGYRAEPIADELNVYGHAIEKYLDWLMALDRENISHSFAFTGSGDFISRPDISKYAVCSPDGYATMLVDSYADVNNRLITDKHLVWEKKTINPYKALRENVFYNGLPFQYIFQVQYQMMLCGCGGGIISSVEIDKDTPFNRGIICGLIEQEQFEQIEKMFNPRVNHFVYGRIKEICEAIEVGLKNFEKAVNEHRPPEVNKAEPRLALNDFKIYQEIYEKNPDGRKLASSAEEFMGTDLHTFVSEYIQMNDIIKDNKKQDDLNKVILKKYLYDNNLLSLYTVDSGEVYLSKSGSLLVRGSR